MASAASSSSSASWKETLVSTSGSVLGRIGVSAESVAYVKKRMGDLLDSVETRMTGVPQSERAEPRSGIVRTD